MLGNKVVLSKFLDDLTSRAISGPKTLQAFQATQKEYAQPKFFLNKSTRVDSSHLHLVRIYLFSEADPVMRTYKTVRFSGNATVLDVFESARKKFGHVLDERFNYSLVLFNRGKGFHFPLVNLLSRGDI